MTRGNSREKRWDPWLGLAAWLIVCFAVAAIGSALTATSVRTWYPGLHKPALTPPAWVFGPAWGALYAMMAVAAWLVWRPAGWSGAGSALALFAIQLALNVAWSGVFFGLKSPGPAFAEIVALWLAIAATCAAFFPRSAAAGWLLVPYLAWVSFAAYLNFAIWRLNRVGP